MCAIDERGVGIRPSRHGPRCERTHPRPASSKLVAVPMRGEGSSFTRSRVTAPSHRDIASVSCGRSEAGRTSRRRGHRDSRLSRPQLSPAPDAHCPRGARAAAGASRSHTLAEQPSSPLAPSWGCAWAGHAARSAPPPRRATAGAAALTSKSGRWPPRRRPDADGDGDAGGPGAPVQPGAQPVDWGSDVRRVR